MKDKINIEKMVDIGIVSKVDFSFEGIDKRIIFTSWQETFPMTTTISVPKAAAEEIISKLKNCKGIVSINGEKIKPSDAKQKTIIAIEGNLGSGKTHLLQTLKNKFGERNIIFQDLDQINSLVRGGPMPINKRKLHEPTYEAIKQLINNANDEQQIIVISGIAVWDDIDLFSNYSLKDESCHLIKYWYQVDPVESLIRYMFRFTKTPDSDKEIIRQYLKANIKTQLNDINLRNISTLDVNRKDVDKAIRRLENVIRQYRWQDKDTIESLVSCGALRHNVPRSNIITFHGYRPATQQEIEQHISKLLDNTYVHSAQWSIRNEIDNLPDYFTQKYKNELIDLIEFICKNYFCDYKIAYAPSDHDNSRPIVIFPSIGLEYNLIEKDGSVRLVQKIIDEYNKDISAPPFEEPPFAYTKQKDITSALGDKEKPKINLEPYEIKFKYLLEQLKENGDLLAQKAQTNSRYWAVALSVEDLYETLEKEMGTFFATPSATTFQECQKKCEAIIIATANESAQHRGWHKIDPIIRGITGVLAALTLVPALIVAATSTHGYFQTFFAKPATATSEKINPLTTQFEKQLNEAGEVINKLNS